MAEGLIYWHQGLFLQPQHFQIANRQVADLVAPLFASSRPFFWGMASGGINESALAVGRLELVQLQCLFPHNAMMIEFPGNAVCGGRQIPLESIPVEGSLTVYVGLRSFKPGEANVTVAENREQMAAATTRLVVPVEPEIVADSYGNGPSAQIRRMSHVLNLVFENELPQVGDMDLLPVARLLRQGDKAVLDPAFVPPCLTLGVSAVLSAMVKDLRDRVLGKALQIEGYKNLAGRGGSSGETIVLLLGLRVLSLFAARLDQAVGNPCISPWEAYSLLRELVAELSVFSLDVSPLGENDRAEKLLPTYAHTELGNCFSTTRDLLLHLLDGISAGPRFLTRFEYRDSYWTADIPKQILSESQTKDAEYWLVLYSETVDAQYLRDSAARLLKLSATRGIESLLVRALPGIPVLAAEGAPAGLLRRQGASYFQVGRDSPLWDDVAKDGSLSLYWSEAPADLDAQLAVIVR